MKDNTQLSIIARIKTDFPAKFGIPRQSGLVPELRGVIVFEPEYRNAEALRGLSEYSHLWLIWKFSEAVSENWSPTVRPPRLGGNKRVGVFATRSPFRPNPLGLSSVKLEKIVSTASFGTVIEVSGVDLMDGTPIYDIKPYIPYTDAHPEAVGGFSTAVFGKRLEVVFTADTETALPSEKLCALRAVLENDPRPAYQNDSERIYGFEFSGYNVSFRVEDGILYVTELTKA